MTHEVMRRWIDVVETGRMDELADMLADDVIFYSPAVFTPQEGRAKTVAYLTAAGKMFANAEFHYVEQWYSDRSAILEFAATVDGMYVNGIDMVHWNDAGKITSVKVMMRPMKALHTIVPMMAELLQQS